MKKWLMIVGSSSLLVAGAAFPSSAVVAATPTCDGRPATIVGTAGPDEIRGTSGPDVIVGKGGADDIDGRGGRDRICGGRGDDLIGGDGGNDRLFGGKGDDLLHGGRGHDDLFGFSGGDWILGGNGDDFIDGGAGSDDCSQGAGSGTIRNCESADLDVDVDSPTEAPAGNITFTVEVTNNGPDAVNYTLRLTEDNESLKCGAYPWEEEDIVEPILAAGATRSEDYVVSCTDEAADGGRVWVHALVYGRYKETHPTNNESESTTTVP